MGLVTTFWPLIRTGVVELVFQTIGEARLVANSKVNTVAFVGQVRRTLVPEGMMVSCGATGTICVAPATLHIHPGPIQLVPPPSTGE